MDKFKIYKAVFDSNPDALLVVEYSGKINMINKHVEVMLGYSEDELIGRNINILIPDYNCEKHEEYFKHFIEKLHDNQLEKDKGFSINKKNGEKIFVDVRLRPVNFIEQKLAIVSIRDITDKIISKKILEASELRYQNTLNTMMEGAQIISFDWRYIYVNDAFVRHSKCTREELMCGTVLELYPGIEQTPIYDVYLKCFSERVSIHLENEFTFPDGSSGWFDLSFQPVPEGIFILSIDITERKLAEINLQNKNTELLRMNKELEQFAYIASHDLQEPLKTISSFTDRIKKEYGGKFDETYVQYSDFICKSVDRMKQLISGLLEYSCIGKRKNLELLDCNTICYQTIADLYSTINECHAEIEIYDLPVLNGYEPELSQLFKNLISNAIKFRNKNIPPKIEIKAEKKSKSWLFSIKDNGIGIDEKDYEQIFLIFQRLHNRADYEGSGIGLAHCRKIIELHGGEIWLESALNKGTTFYFTVPLIKTTINQRNKKYNYA